MHISFEYITVYHTLVPAHSQWDISREYHAKCQQSDWTGSILYSAFFSPRVCCRKVFCFIFERHLNFYWFIHIYLNAVCHACVCLLYKILARVYTDFVAYLASKAHVRDSFSINVYLLPLLFLYFFLHFVNALRLLLRDPKKPLIVIGLK